MQISSGCRRKYNDTWFVAGKEAVDYISAGRNISDQIKEVLFRYADSEVQLEHSTHL